MSTILLTHLTIDSKANICFKEAKMFCDNNINIDYNLIYKNCEHVDQNIFVTK